jgi:hypothetical protein
MMHMRCALRALPVALLVLSLLPAPAGVAAAAARPPAPVRAPAPDGGWLDSLLDSIPKVLGVIQKWNTAIDQITDQAKRQQLHQRMNRLYRSFRDLETRKQDLIRTLLAPRPVLGSVNDTIDDLETTVNRIGDEINKISLELNLQNAVNGNQIEQQMRDDLSQKAQYLDNVKRLLRDSNGQLPDTERRNIKEQGEKALAAIGRARLAIADVLKRLEAN